MLELRPCHLSRMHDAGGGRLSLPGVRRRADRHAVVAARVVTRSQTRARWQRSGVPGGMASSPTKRALIVHQLRRLHRRGDRRPRANRERSPGRPLCGSAPCSYSVLVLKHEYWRLFTAMFLHAGHLPCGRQHAVALLHRLVLRAARRVVASTSPSTFSPAWPATWRRLSAGAGGCARGRRVYCDLRRLRRPARPTSIATDTRTRARFLVSSSSGWCST